LHAHINDVGSIEHVSQPAGSDRQIVVLENAPPGRRTERRTPPAIDDQAAHRRCERRGVSGGDEQSRLPGYDDFPHPASCSRHYGQPTRLRLEQRHAKGFVVGRPNEKIRRGQALGD
jgi:hypothetical protein